MYNIGDNVFKDQPVVGTVVAIVTPEELAEQIALGDLQDATMHSQTSTLQQKIDASAAYRKWWFQILEKYEVPYAWEVKIDQSSGAIFVAKKGE